MNKFSSTSQKRLLECEKDLQLLCESVLQDMDITILCGHRNEADQEAAFKAGKSKAHFGQSPHNFTPSRAVDVAPYPINFNDIKSFEKMCELFEQHAEKLGIEITLGRDFSFKDLVHFELKNWKWK